MCSAKEACLSTKTGKDLGEREREPLTCTAARRQAGGGGGDAEKRCLFYGADVMGVAAAAVASPGGREREGF